MEGTSKRVRIWFGVIVSVALGSPHAAAEPPATAGANDAMTVLRTHCAPCHGGPSFGSTATRGGFGHVLDPVRLRSEGQVVPGAPGTSELYQKLLTGDMPPASVRQRPTARDIAAVRSWIARSRAAPNKATSTLTPQRVDALIASDLARLPRSARPHTRYVSLAHMTREGASDADLLLAKNATTKLLNSLSWKRSLARFPTLGARAAIMRVNLPAIGWTAASWRVVAAKSPYTAVRASRHATRIQTMTGTHTPVVRADWLVTEASRGASYNRLLRIPPRFGQLERRLGINTTDNVLGRRVLRAGFAASGVSRHNRIIERHTLPRRGYLWRSYDFKSSRGRRNIFAHPLEPALSKRGFRHDGGEYIFSLPNGMQGYMLTDRRGNRIDAAPTSIVNDPNRPDGVVRNGVSCMGCHTTGIIHKRDAIRPHVEANRLAFSRSDLGLAARALALYGNPNDMNTAMLGDRQRFETALSSLGIASGVEPVGWLVRRYEADASARTVAAELGVSPAVLTALLRTDAALATRLGVIARGGSAKREVLAAAFPSLVQRFGLGRPLRALGRSARDELACRSRDAAACNRAAREADLRVDRPNALRLYEAACRLRSARACHVVGQRRLRGIGGPRDLTRAAAALSRACARGRSGACVKLGNLHYNGGGVRRSITNALGYYEQACRLGAAQGCANAATLHDGGRSTPLQRRRAAPLHERACAGNITKSCMRAATLYYEGRYVPRNRNKAARLFDRACSGGNGSACRRVAVQYRWGLGVRANWIRSERLFRRACRLGVGRACLYL